MQAGGLRILSLIYLRLGCKDAGIRKSEFVAKTQFLFNLEFFNMYNLLNCFLD